MPEVVGDLGEGTAVVVGGSMQIVQAPVRERMETKARRHVKAASAEVKTLVMSAMAKV